MNIERRQPISLGDTSYLDIENEVIIKDGLPIGLSRIQFRILYCLAQHMGQMVPDQHLISYAWGHEDLARRNDLYVFINRLRNKIEDNPNKPQFLISLRGVGYVLYPKREKK